MHNSMTFPTPLSTQLDPHQLRIDFPILQTTVQGGMPLVYLDNGASTQRPQMVLDSMNDCYSRYYSNVHRGIHSLSETSTHAFEQARQTLADFIHAASAKEVIFTAGTTAGINTVARSWGDQNLRSGDMIVLTMAEHHANIVPWQQLATRTGCELVFLPIDRQGHVDAEQMDLLWQRHAERIKLFAFTAVSNVLGTINPVQRWVQRAHQIDAIALVDAAQAAPHMTIDIQAWDADFVVFSGHKMCGPTGIGILYGREALLEAMPPFLGGGAMIRSVTTQGFTSADLPEKFEAGTPPIVEAIGLATAANYLSQVGLPAIHAHEQQLTQLAHELLTQIPGLRLLGPEEPTEKGGIVSFVIAGLHPHDISQWLDMDGIAVRAGHHCAMPLHQSLEISASTRASFYLYNTAEEIEKLATGVQRLQTKVTGGGRRRRSAT